MKYVHLFMYKGLNEFDLSVFENGRWQEYNGLSSVWQAIFKRFVNQSEYPCLSVFEYKRSDSNHCRLSNNILLLKDFLNNYHCLLQSFYLLETEFPS